MGVKEELFRQFNQGHGEWHQFIESIRISNIHGWHNQEMVFKYPVAAIVGSYDIVKTLDELCRKKKLSVKGFGIVDGDKRKECPDCISLPGSIAPEIMVFDGLKEKGWDNLDSRFGVGAGNLFAWLDNAMLTPDHHEWTTILGDCLKKSKDNVWLTMVEEWCSQCLQEDELQEFFGIIDERVNGY